MKATEIRKITKSAIAKGKTIVKETISKAIEEKANEGESTLTINHGDHTWEKIVRKPEFDQNIRTLKKDGFKVNETVDEHEEVTTTISW